MFVRKMKREPVMPFDDLETGDVFKHVGRICLKVSQESDEYNAFDLDTKKLFILSELFAM